MAKKKTEEQFVMEMKSIFANLDLVGPYTNVNTKTRFKCLIHDFEFYAYPCNILAGHGCKQCGAEKNAMARRKPHEQFVTEIEIINPDVEIIGKYVDTKTKVLVRCKIDGYIWQADPKKLRRCVKCAVCTNRVVMPGVNDIATTRPDLVKYFKNKDDATKYTSGSEHELTFVCPVDGEEKVMQISHLSSFGFCCNACYERQYGRKRVPYKYWNEQTMRKHLNDNYCGYLLLDVTTEQKRSGNQLKALIKCPNPNHDAYWVYWTNVLSGYQCSLCYIEDSMSKGERAAELVFKKYHYEYESQKRFNDCRDKHTLPFDFYLQEYNLVVEIMGEQHEYPIEHFGGQESFKLRVYHDKIKRDYLKARNIHCLDIWYYEYDKMEELIVNKIQEIISQTTQN